MDLWEGFIMANDLNMTMAQRERISRIMTLSAPLLLLVGVLYWLAFRYSGIDLKWGAVGIGALGWLAALILRAPVGLAVKNLPDATKERAVVFSSGPLEEGLRIAALALAGRDFLTAISVGFGWAMIEVLFTLQQVLIIATLLKKDDAKSRQAIAMLKERGMLPENPSAWGIVERIFASAMHMGNTLLVAFNPWLVIVLAPLHSATNWFISKMAPKSLVKGELLMAAIGTVMFVLGLLAMGRL
jgi:hypothetical protein